MDSTKRGEEKIHCRDKKTKNPYAVLTGYTSREGYQKPFRLIDTMTGKKKPIPYPLNE